MTDMELRKLSRKDLLKMMIEQEKELSRLKQENSELKTEYSRAKNSAESLLNRLEDKDIRTSELLKKLDLKDAEYKTLSVQNETLKASNNRLKANIEDLKIDIEEAKSAPNRYKEENDSLKDKVKELTIELNVQKRVFDEQMDRFESIISDNSLRIIRNPHANEN